MIKGTSLHLTFKPRDPDRIGEKKVWRRLVENIIDALDMKLMAEVFIPFESPLDYACRGGLTYAFVIAESHICIHTFPEYGLVWFDVVSCKPFEVGKVWNHIRDVFNEAENVQMNNVDL